MKTDSTEIEPAGFFLPVCCGVIAQMFCAGLVFAVTVVSFTPRSERNLTMSAEMTATSKEAPVNNGDADVAVDHSQVTPASQPVAPNIALQKPPNEPDSETSSQTNRAESADPQPEVPAKPLDDVRGKLQQLPLVGGDSTDKVPLCRVDVDDVSHVELSLVGATFFKPHEVTLTLEPTPVDKQSRMWRVKQRAKAGFDRNQTLGEFSLINRQLTFQWEKDVDKGKLPFCRLKLSAESDTEICSLWTPVQASGIRLSFSKNIQTLQPFVPRGVQLPPAECLQLKVKLKEWPTHTLSGDTLTVGQPVQIVIPHETTDDHLLKVVLSLKSYGSSPVLETSYSTTVPKLSSRRLRANEELKYEQRELSRTAIKKLTEDFRKAALSHRRDADELETDTEDLQAKLEILEEAQLTNPRQEVISQQRLLERKLETLTNRYDATDQLATAFLNAHTAMIHLEHMCQEIEHVGRIQFELSRPLDAGTTEIRVSSSNNAVANRNTGVAP